MLTATTCLLRRSHIARRARTMTLALGRRRSLLPLPPAQPLPLLLQRSPQLRPLRHQRSPPPLPCSSRGIIPRLRSVHLSDHAAPTRLSPTTLTRRGPTRVAAPPSPTPLASQPLLCARQTLMDVLRTSALPLIRRRRPPPCGMTGTCGQWSGRRQRGCGRRSRQARRRPPSYAWMAARLLQRAWPWRRRRRWGWARGGGR